MPRPLLALAILLLSAAAFAGALLSKALAITLPGVLVLLDLHLGRFDRDGALGTAAPPHAPFSAC